MHNFQNKYAFIAVVIMLFSLNAVAENEFEQSSIKPPRVCLSGNTSVFYAKNKRCFSVPRRAEDGTLFKIQGQFIGAESGKADRPTVVMIPGGPGDSGADFFLSLENHSLPGAFYKHLDVNTIYFDPRGTSGSEIPGDFLRLSDRTFSTKNAVDDLKSILDHLHLKGNVILLAHSAGGATAYKFAEQYPEYLSGLILYNAVASLKETGRHILTFESARHILLEDALKSSNVPREQLQELLQSYNRIENAIINEKLLAIHGQIEKLQISKMSLFAFRHLALKWALIGGDRFQEFLDAHEERMNFDADYPRAAPIAAKDLFRERWFQSSFLKATMFCAEALTDEYKQKSFVYPGLTMNYLCQDVHAVSEDVEVPNLENITTPALFLVGGLDTSVIWSHQKRNADQMPDTTFVKIEGAGHTFHSTHTMEFYYALESWLK